MTNGPGNGGHPVPAEEFTRAENSRQQQHSYGRPEGMRSVLKHLRPSEAVASQGYGL